MKLTARSIATFVLLAAATAPASAQQTATQLVRFSVRAQQQAEVQRVPAAMSIDGRGPAVATGSYVFSSNESNRKISASLDQAMPSGASLVVTMEAPDGARSAGATTLGTDAKDMVTAIPAVVSSGLPVRYAVRGSVEDANGSAEQRLVTYTVTAAP